MATYNINKIYNNRINYNASTDYIIAVSDSMDSEILVLVESNVSVLDKALGQEALDVVSKMLLGDIGSGSNLLSLISNINISDSGISDESLTVSFHDVLVRENARVDSSISVESIGINLCDIGLGNDSVTSKSVANYNSRKSYNKRWDAGGASYNSYKHHIVMIEDFGNSTDDLKFFFGDLSFMDSITTNDAVSIAPVDISLNDKVISKDVMELISNIYTSDSGVMLDVVELLEFSASEYLIVTTHNILEPLGVKVTNDSRHELMPATRDSTEEIPGKHGEYDFGTEFSARILELSVVTNNGYTSLEKSDLQRLFAMYLNPLKGPRKLVFADDMDKEYTVKYSGKMDINNRPNWFNFVIPFKMSNPFISGTFEKKLIGNGKLFNSGTHETGLIIKIDGPATNPSLTIDGKTLTYSNTVGSGQVLIIDTSKEVAKIGNTNAMVDYNGVFPLLYPGEMVVVAPSNVTIRWRDKWI